MNYIEIDKLLKEVDSQFVKHLGFPEKASGIPPYLFSTPVPIKTDTHAYILNQLLIKPDILPPSWKTVLSDLEDVTRIESGAYLSSRNFARDLCYIDSTKLNICYVTQFTFWYPSIKKANDEWERNYSQLGIGEPSDFGVWRIPDDINFPDMRADQAFIRCATFAVGEECQVYIRYESYLIVLIAEMQSAHTLMGHDRNGITHDEFLLLIKEVDKNSSSVLGIK